MQTKSTSEPMHRTDYRSAKRRKSRWGIRMVQGWQRISNNTVAHLLADRDALVMIVLDAEETMDIQDMALYGRKVLAQQMGYVSLESYLA